jgi:hypothetical protein
MTLGAVRVRGALDVTTTGGGNLTQLVSQRVLAAQLQGDISGSITLTHLRNDFAQIGDSVVGLHAGSGMEIWSGRPRAAILDGVISTTTGDIVLVANPSGKFGYFTLGANIDLQPGNRWVIYSYYDKVPSLATDLEAGLGPDAILAGQVHPYGGVLPAGNVLIYVQQTGP